MKLVTAIMQLDYVVVLWIFYRGRELVEAPLAPIIFVLPHSIEHIQSEKVCVNYE